MWVSTWGFFNFNIILTFYLEYFFYLCGILKHNDMKLELKNVKFYESMSEETNCFKADLFINGKKIAYVKNDGRGGCTDYQLMDLKNKQILREAEEFCLSLPKVDYGTFKFQPTLESKIDDLFEVWLKAKADKALLKQMDKGIIYGTPERYRMTYWKNTTLVALLQNPVGQARIKQILKDLIEKGETILNTNIPKELYPN